MSFLPFIDQFVLEAKVYGSMEGNVRLSVGQSSLVSLIQTEIYQQLLDCSLLNLVQTNANANDAKQTRSCKKAFALF